MLSTATSSKSAAITSSSELELRELNDALDTLATIFPNIRPEVFREMLTILSKESRAQVVAEHLLRSGTKWVRGRWRFPAQETNSQIIREVYDLNPEGTVFGTDSMTGRSSAPADEDQLVPLEEKFRTEGYKTAVFVALRHEFKSLSRSTIQGVLAEQNFSYTLSRPVLTGLAAKTWRVGFMSLFTRLTKTSTNKHAADEDHHMLQWTCGASADRNLRSPYLRPTGDAELDSELKRTVLDPVLNRRQARENAISFELAVLLNEQEAEQAGAIYECQVCFADVAFEQVAMCTGSDDAHIICFGCIRRAMSEALYGQSWELTIDHDRGQMACIATASSSCGGCIPRALALRAIEAAKGGQQLWEQFERRVLHDSLHHTGLPLVKCPFCSYAEINVLYLSSEPVWMLNTMKLARTSVLLLLGFDLAVLLTVLIALPLLILVLLGLPIAGFRPHILLADYVQRVLQAALSAHLRRTQLSQRFTCQNPSCKRSSCIECRKPWRDVHKCHDSAVTSLRTTVEAARTAALKRTCPRCGVGFVKDSGCNKMVCVCGYAMCYICREGVGEKKGGRLVPDDAENHVQGYRHFCQHFRPMGGRCTECDRCDLYRAEDEDEIVKRAGERAEREWKQRNDVGEDVHMAFEEPDSLVGVLLDHWKRFSIQGAANWWIANVLVCRLDKSGHVAQVTTSMNEIGNN